MPLNGSGIGEGGSIGEGGRGGEKGVRSLHVNNMIKNRMNDILTISPCKRYSKGLRIIS
jgi:hypothetical protein